jgi:hypothetical protein
MYTQKQAPLHNWSSVLYLLVDSVAGVGRTAVEQSMRFTAEVALSAGDVAVRLTFAFVWRRGGRFQYWELQSAQCFVMRLVCDQW